MPTTKTAKTSTPAELVGEICLYGASHCGAGWLAAHKGGRLGSGEPVSGRTFTEAVWMAAGALEAAGVTGLVVIHDAGGERHAVANVARIPMYGQMVWHRSGPGVVVSAEVILAAAAAQV